MDDPITEFDIEAYIDDALDPVRRLAVEDYLSRDAAAASRVMADLRSRGALRMALQFGGNIPEHLSNAAEPLRQRLNRRRWRLPALIGLASAASLSLFALPIDADGQVPHYVSNAVMSHKVGLMRAAMTSQIESPYFDPREVLRSTSIRMPVLPRGWRVTDVQLFPAEAGPALQMMLLTASGKTLSMFAIRNAQSAGFNPVGVRHGGEAAAYWSRNGTAYVLTGALSPGDLDRAADDLADNNLS